MARPIVVLILASGATWESTALAVLERDPGVVVLRRCVDVPDLLAAATAGQADAAVVAVEAPGLDQAAVEHLRRCQVRPTVVVPAGASDEHRLRAARLGVTSSLAGDDLAGLASSLRSAERHETADSVLPVSLAEESSAALPGGRVVAVWGPAGAPGRTTVAVGVAAELAARRRHTTLVDADPYGGAVAQQLGILDEVSGLLAAARLAGSRQLEARFGSVRRGVSEHLTVVTGLPRSDRWVELRSGSVEHLLEVAAAHGDVLVDTGFSLETDPVSEIGTRPARNHATLAALARADEVLVVGSADPVGLARLVRALRELREAVPDSRVRVVVNRMRSSLGWSEAEVTGMVEGYVALEGLHFLPDDRPTVDRALVGGHTLVELGDSALRKALSPLVDALVPAADAGSGRLPRASARRRAGRRIRQRTAGRGRPR